MTSKELFIYGDMIRFIRSVSRAYEETETGDHADELIRRYEEAEMDRSIRENPADHGHEENQ